MPAVVAQDTALDDVKYQESAGCKHKSYSLRYYGNEMNHEIRFIENPKASTGQHTVKGFIDYVNSVNEQYGGINSGWSAWYDRHSGINVAGCSLDTYMFRLNDTNTPFHPHGRNGTNAEGESTNHVWTPGADAWGLEIEGTFKYEFADCYSTFDWCTSNGDPTDWTAWTCKDDLRWHSGSGSGSGLGSGSKPVSHPLFSRPRCLYFVYFAWLSSSGRFTSVFFAERGLSDTQIGVLMGARSVASLLVVQPMSALADYAELNGWSLFGSLGGPVGHEAVMASACIVTALCFTAYALPELGWAFDGSGDGEEEASDGSASSSTYTYYFVVRTLWTMSICSTYSMIVTLTQPWPWP